MFQDSTKNNGGPPVGLTNPSAVGLNSGSTGVVLRVGVGAVDGVGGLCEEEDESAGAVCELREDVGSLEEVILTHNAFIRKVASEAGIR